MSMCKMICVHYSCSCLAHADVIWVYPHYTAVVSEFLDSLMDMTLCLGHVFFFVVFFVISQRKEEFRKASAATCQTVVLHYEMRSKCYVMM